MSLTRVANTNIGKPTDAQLMRDDYVRDVLRAQRLREQRAVRQPVTLNLLPGAQSHASHPRVVVSKEMPQETNCEHPTCQVRREAKLRAVTSQHCRTVSHYPNVQIANYVWRCAACSMILVEENKPLDHVAPEVIAMGLKHVVTVNYGAWYRRVLAEEPDWCAEVGVWRLGV